MSNAKAPVVKCAVLRLESANLIIPRNLLAELVTVEHLQRSKHPSVLGWMKWLNRLVPAVSLEKLCGLSESVTTANTYLILHTVSTDQIPFIALKVQGGLQTVDIHEDTLRDEPSTSVKPCAYIARQVRIAQLVCFIPDLPALETLLLNVWRSSLPDVA